MICAQCGQPLLDDELYVEARRWTNEEVTSYRALVSDIVVHVQCPPTFIPPAIDPTTMLQCCDCPHVAAQHGFVFDRITGKITFGDMACTVCDCKKFNQNISITNAPWRS